VLVISAAILFEVADRMNQQRRRGAVQACLVVCAVLWVSALALGWIWLDGLGIDPTGHSYGATVWTLLGFVGLHVALALVMALWCLLRVILGMIDDWRCLTLRIALLWSRFTTAAAIITLVLVAVFPHVIT
jgi:cytochrome c oxidase subunit I+III